MHAHSSIYTVSTQATIGTLNRAVYLGSLVMFRDVSAGTCTLGYNFIGNNRLKFGT